MKRSKARRKIDRVNLPITNRLFQTLRASNGWRIRATSASTERLPQGSNPVMHVARCMAHDCLNCQDWSSFSPRGSSRAHSLFVACRHTIPPRYATLLLSPAPALATFAISRNNIHVQVSRQLQVNYQNVSFAIVQGCGWNGHFRPLRSPGISSRRCQAHRYASSWSTG